MAGTFRIEVCGGIASGKTSLAGLFKREKCIPLFENFKANPFWKQFYADPKRVAFETELTFLLQHYNQIKVALDSKSLLVCDFSFLLDRAYVDVTLANEERCVFLTVLEEVQQQLGVPALYVHLDCSPEEELRRVRLRGRQAEKRVEIGYLADLNEAVARHVEAAQTSVPVLRIDSEHRNFLNDRTCQDEVVAEIMSLIVGHQFSR